MYIVYTCTCTCNHHVYTVRRWAHLVEVAVWEHEDFEGIPQSVRVLHLHHRHVVQLVQRLEPVPYGALAPTDVCCHHEAVVQQERLHLLHIFMSVLQ